MKIEVRLDFNFKLKENEIVFCLKKEKSINSLIKSIFRLMKDKEIEYIEDTYYYIYGNDSAAVFAVISTVIEEISRIYFSNLSLFENYKNQIEYIKQ